jgi:hypothetical protein
MSTTPKIAIIASSAYSSCAPSCQKVTPIRIKTTNTRLISLFGFGAKVSSGVDIIVVLPKNNIRFFFFLLFLLFL